MTPFNRRVNTAVKAAWERGRKVRTTAGEYFERHPCVHWGLVMGGIDELLLFAGGWREDSDIPVGVLGVLGGVCAAGAMFVLLEAMARLGDWVRVFLPFTMAAGLVPLIGLEWMESLDQWYAADRRRLRAPSRTRRRRQRVRGGPEWVWVNAPIDPWIVLAYGGVLIVCGLWAWDWWRGRRGTR